MKLLLIITYVFSFNPDFQITFSTADLRFPPTMLGNPTPPYTGVYKGAVFSYMGGEDASITRLSYLHNGRMNSTFAFRLEGGISKFVSEGESQTIPILMIGLKLRHDFGNITGAMSLSIGIPELISPSLDIGIKSHGAEFLTLRGGAINGVAIHYNKFDFALLMNLFATDLNFFSPPSFGLSAGWRLK